MRLTCRATKAAVGAEITSVLRQVDRMMHSVGRRYYQGRRWGRMRPRDWLVLFPDWPCAAPEIAVDEGVRLGVLSVLPAGELGQWLSVDYATLVCRISNAEKDLPRWLGDRLAENTTHDYSYSELVKKVKKRPRGRMTGSCRESTTRRAVALAAHNSSCLLVSHCAKQRLPSSLAQEAEQVSSPSWSASLLRTAARPVGRHPVNLLPANLSLLSLSRLSSECGIWPDR